MAITPIALAAQLGKDAVKLLAEPLEVMFGHSSGAGDMVNRVHGG